MSLVEVVLYLCAISFWSLFVFSHISSFQTNIGKINLSENFIIQESCLLDLIRRDCASSSNSSLDWDFKNFLFKKKSINLKDKKTEEIIVQYKFCPEGVYRMENNNSKTSSKICNKNYSFALKPLIDEKNKKIKFLLLRLDNLDTKEYLINIENKSV